MQRPDILAEILDLLISRWGYRRVLASLDRLNPAAEPAVVRGRRSKGIAAKRRLTPVEMVERRKIGPKKKREIAMLAASYEAKDFLPTIADVRHFLDVRGIDVGKAKNRGQAFGKVLDLLMKLPEGETVRLRNSAVHGRPGTLAPVAEAITSVAEERRSVAAK